MNDRWERRASLTGAAAAGLWVATVLVAGEPPAADAPLAQIMKYFAAGSRRVLTAQALIGVGYVAFLWFFAVLGAHLRRAEGSGHLIGSLVLAAGGAFVLTDVGGDIAFFSLARGTASGGAEPVIRAVLRLAETAEASLPFLAAGVLLAVAAGAIRTRALPGWLAWSALSLSGLLILSDIAGLLGADGLGASSDAGKGLLLLFLSWVAVVSIDLFRSASDSG